MSGQSASGWSLHRLPLKLKGASKIGRLPNNTRPPLLFANVHQIDRRRRANMANVYVEPRPKGRPEGSPIEDYVVEDHADHALGTFKTQHEAVDWAKGQGHTPHVARVRHLSDKKKADHWRVV